MSLESVPEKPNEAELLPAKLLQHFYCRHLSTWLTEHLGGTILDTGLTCVSGAVHHVAG